MIEISTNTRFVRLHAVMRMVGLSRSQIYKLIGEGQFPGQIRLSSRSVAWIEGEVIAWMRDRPKCASHSTRWLLA